jgi:hypothetical protein
MKGNWKHGLSGTKMYRRWASMVGRCRYRSHTSWKWYGAKGIKVCSRWLDFEKFIFDMGFPPFIGATIERKNSFEDYKPSNCFWATQKQQQRNRRNKMLLTLNGITQSAGDWADYLHVPLQRIHSRKERGWSDERTLTIKTKVSSNP